jgi:hypothetical protein
VLPTVGRRGILFPGRSICMLEPSRHRRRIIGERARQGGTRPDIGEIGPDLAECANGVGNDMAAAAGRNASGYAASREIFPIFELPSRLLQALVSIQLSQYDNRAIMAHQK